jgi:1-acyl-sn-glycerol-3-phosphate acyltransferase
MTTSSRASSGRLLLERRFWPLFVAQFCGAFNDNFFKSAFVLILTFQGISLFGLGAEQLVALAGGVFILPFFLFSAFAGQLADKYPKAALIRWVKLAEVGVLLLGGLSFVVGSAALSFSVLFLLGTQATLFGPLKYGVLPELLGSEELVAGNALVELGTFLAILLGTLAGGILIGLGPAGTHWVTAIMLGVSGLGWLATLRLRSGPAADPSLSVEPRVFRPTWRLLGLAQGQRALWNAILGISWFWLLGSVVLSVLPGLVKTELHGTEGVVTYFLALFSIGVGAGAVLAEKLSYSRLELGLVPLGSLGISVFLVDAGLALAFGPAGPATGVVPLAAFLQSGQGVRLSLDFLAFSISSGLFTVPLYTLLQQRSEGRTRARIIAANNVANAVFMVAGAVLLVGLFAAGVSIPMVLGLCALLNLAVAVYIYSVIPEFMLRLWCYLLAHVLYRVRVRGSAFVPKEGAAVLVANHITFVDWMVIACVTQRPMRFVMDHAYANAWLVRRVLRDAKVIPIASAKVSPDILESAFGAISEALRDGELVCIFPEGRLTSDGQIGQFKRGIERILARDPVPVVPMHLDGLYGSYFSRAPSRRLFGRLWSRVELNVGAPIAPEGLTAPRLEERIRELGGVASAPHAAAAYAVEGGPTRQE